jgi:hypothetical protein
LDFSRLKENICEVITEEQIKLGYRKEVIRLYYPLKSLNRFLDADFSCDEMEQALKGFCAEMRDSLGKTESSHEGERFCFLFSPEVSEHIHTHRKPDGFLPDFIETVSRHGVSMEEVIALFRKYSDHVHVEKVNHGEFDYLVYFEDGKPDKFRYCLTDEGCHIIYHRFTEDDYNDFQFGE